MKDLVIEISLKLNNHPWLKHFDWKALHNRTLEAPFIPPKIDNYDSKYTNYDFKDHYSLMSLKEAKGMIDKEIKDVDDIQNYFKDYYYDFREKQTESRHLNSTFPMT